MQYDKYELRVARLAKLLKLMFKHMTKIIISASVMLVTATTLLATRGIVSADECPSQIVYGEELDYSASAFLSNTKLQYCKSGTDEWSEEVPTEVGAYNVRAVAKATFGYRYGNVETFTIKPKEVHVVVSSKSVVYGENPELVSDLEYSDVITCDNFIYTDGRTGTEPTLSAIKIFDKEGKDVTNCYMLSTESSQITTLKRPITIDVVDKQKVYDGTELTSEEYVISSGSVANGDKLVMSFGASIVNVGAVSNNATFKILNSQGEDVTGFYSVEKNDGMLYVNARPITIETASESVVYDGLVHSNHKGMVTGEYGGLVGNHTVVYENWASAVEAGSHENAASYKLVDADGNSVERNYKVTFKTGTIDILKRPITVETESCEHVYDGAMHSAEKYSVTGELAPAQTVSVSGWASRIDVGKTENTFNLEIFDGNGRNQSHNYDITYNYGNISISKLPITVTTPTDDELYDGSEWSRIDLSYDTLAVGDRLNVTQKTTVGNKVGVYTNEVEFDIYDEQRQKSVKDNYEITEIKGTLTVKARPLTVTSGTLNEVYNGTEYSCTDLTFTDMGIVSGQSYKITKSAKVLGVCKDVENEILIEIYKGNENVTDNYDISYSYGTITVTPREITVTVGNAEREYDGSQLFGNEPSVSNIVPTHSFSVKNRTSITDVGSCVNEILEYDIFDESGNSVKGNYAVSFENGTLTVTPRQIILETESKTEYYNAQPLTADGWLVSSRSPNGLVDGHEIVANKPNGSQTEAGTSLNDYSGEIYIYCNGIDVTRNYAINPDIILGELTVLPRPITVTLGDAERVYDGSQLFGNEPSVSNIVPTHSFSVKNRTSITDVGSCVNEILEYDIFDESGNSVRGNYAVSFENGTLTVTPRKITIKTESESFVYDGEAHSKKEYSIINGDLAPGQRLNINDSSWVEITDVGEIDNTFEFEIVDGSGSVISKHNYEITYSYGTLTVTPRKITVTMGDASKEYDAITLYGNEPAVNNLVSGHSFVIVERTSITDAGSCENTVTRYEIRDENGALINPDNYDVTIEVGTLTVTPRKIIVTMGDASKEYDALPLFGNEPTVNNLVSGHSFVIIERTSITDAGSCENTVTRYEIRDENGALINHDNYDVTIEVGTLTVTPREITVTVGNAERVYDGSIFYGDDPVVVGIVSSHRFVVTKRNGITDVGSVINKIHEYEILDENDDPVNLGNYDISIVDGGTITVTPRPITVTLGDAERVYDGSQLFGNEPTVENIVAGHRFVVTNRSSITEVGSVTNEIYEYEIRDVNGELVSLDNYDVTVIEGTLTVKPRKITIKTEDKTFLYDGEAHSHKEYSIGAEGLAPGQKLNISSWAEITDVGETDNTFEFEIVDGSGAIISKDNYEITYSYGTLTVEPCKITINTESRTFFYDAVSHSYKKYSIVGMLRSGHELRIDDAAWAEITDVGEIKNTLQFEIVDENGEIVPKDNYEIIYSYGTLTVTPRTLIVKTEDKSFTYDATSHSHKKYSIDGDGLAPGHELKIDDTGWMNITDVGEAENTFKFEIVDGSGTVISNDNYEISYSYGTLTVEKRKLIVSTPDYTGVYDGKDHSNYTLSVILTDGGLELCDGHSFKYGGHTVIKDVYEGENAVAFSIVDKSGADVTKNYDIEEKFGKINVTAREIYPYTVDYSGEYDGKLHAPEVGVNTDLGSALCEGHSFYAKATIKNVVTEEELTAEFIIVDAEGRDVTKNYKIVSVKPGKVTVYPKTVKIKTGSKTWQYNGQEHQCIDFEFVGGTSFVKGHTYKIFASTVTDIGTEDNILEFVVMDGYENVTENYDIEITEYGKISVVQRNITVTSGSDSKNYDGTPLICDKMETATESENELLSGDRIVATVTGTITNPGTVFNIYDKSSVKIMRGDEDVTHLYNISYEHGELTVRDIGDEEEDDEDEQEKEKIDPPYTSVNIGLPEGFDPNDMVIKTLFYVTSTADGRIYLKRASLGDYTGGGWLLAREYDKLMFDYASAYYLTSYTIKNDGSNLHGVRIISTEGEFVLPYYSLDGSSNIQRSDVYVNGIAGDEYYVQYYLGASEFSLPEELVEFEKKYSEFVHEHYLQIDESTKAFMLAIAEQQGINPQNDNVLKAVARYISGVADYNLYYDRALDESEDIAVAFLSKYREGVCQHYATAATMMFRALGIPARYTIGYVGETEADTMVEITNLKGHAWVEVYVDGIGWVQVEVTGPGGIGSLELELNKDPQPDPEPPEDDRPDLMIYPKSQRKVFDGTMLYAEDKLEIDDALRELLEEGYSYYVSVSGKIKYAGREQSFIEKFILYDPDGNDVTEEFEITYMPGDLIVDKAKVEIYIYEKKHVYDGTDVTYADNEYILISKDIYGSFVMNGINISMRNVGVLTSDDLTDEISKFISFSVIEPETGKNISSSYTVYVCNFADGESYNVLEITKRDITITTGSATKKYDGTPLTNKTCTVTEGYINPKHTIILQIDGEITNRGKANNVASKSTLKILDENGNDVTSNYNRPKFVWGELAVS